MGAKKVEDLDVWQLCEEIRVSVTAGIASAPARKDFKFCDQILRAAEDAASNISEGFGRFRPREFAQFLGYAITSTAEVLQRTRLPIAANTSTTTRPRGWWCSAYALTEHCGH